MKLLRFMIRKDMAKSALISLLLALLSCAFLISVLRPSYAYGEKYMTYLKSGSETVSQDAQKLADEQNALNNEINDRKILRLVWVLTVCFLLLRGSFTLSKTL